MLGSLPRVVALTVMLFTVLVSTASADRAFTARYSTNDTGQITGIANSSMTCSAAVAGCTAARSAAVTSTATPAFNNNAYYMGYTDVDSDAATFNSSSATLGLPAGSTILFAGLYWGGDYSAGGAVNNVNGVAAPNVNARNTVKFRAPGATAYTTLTATTLDDSSLDVGRYQGFRDVTALVAAGGNGAYTVADIQAGRGGDSYAGWSLIIAYKNAAEPARNLTIFDGLRTILSSAGPTDIPVSGFLTPPSGTVRTDVGFVTYEGDNGLVGDSAALNGTILSDAQHPPTNFFNSHIAIDGVNQTAKNPDYQNQLGFDMAFVNADGILANSATSATIRVTTAGDQYLPGVVTFATEIYAPKITQNKTVADDNGGQVEQGDVLTYTVTGTNTGDDGTSNFVLRDPIPANTTYVAGSLRVNPTGATPTTVATDAAGDDLGEHVAASAQVVARLGTGATATVGGNVRTNASYSMSFKVRVNGPATTPVPNGTVITNTATASYATQTTGTVLTSSSTATTTVASPDLALTKTRTVPAPPAQPAAGSNVTYTLSTRNVGSASTTGTITVTDPVPSGTTLVSASGSGWTCTGTTTISCTRPDALAAQATAPAITVVLRLADTFSGNLSNTATVRTPGDANLANDTSTDTVASTQVADIALSKVASRSTMNIGDTVTFTLVATNNGPSAATSVAISDPIPTGFEYVSSTPTCTYVPSSGTVGCAIGALSSGASATVSITVRAKAGAGATTQTNTATASSAQTDNNQLNNSASASVFVTGADLLVTKTSSTAEPVRNGDTVTYVATVRNNGASAATGVVLTDVLPSTLTNVTTSNPTRCTVATDVTCTVGDLAAGASFSVTVTGRANAPSGTLTNRASATGNEPDPNLDNNVAQVTKATAPTADLNLTKLASRATASTGDPITYTLSVTNQGPDSAANVVVRDTLPTGLSFTSADAGCTYDGTTRVVTCTLGTIARNQTQTRTFVATVTTNAPAGTLINPAEVTSSTFDDDPSDNEAEAATNIVKAADVSVTKSASPASATTGDALTYTITAANAGPDAATGVTLTDVLPAGVTFSSASSGCTYDAPSRTVTCTVGTIASGSNATRTITTTVTGDATTSIVNTATAAATTPDPNTANNSGSVTTPVVKKADVRITKTAPAGPLAGGDALTYALNVRNNGPDPATNVTVTDVLPAGVNFVMAAGCSYAAPSRTVTCTGFDLGVDADRSFSIITTVVPDAPASITNTATVSAAQTDPVQANNSASATTTTTRKADVVLSKSAPAGPLATGAALRYTLTATNNGPDTASAVSVTDVLPTGVSYTASSSGCTYDGATKTVTCGVAALAPGASAVFTIDTTVLSSSPATIQNTATVTAATTDPTPGNNSATASTTTAKRADLAITKTAPAGPLGTGDTLTYTLTTRNNGPDEATNVVVTDVLPNGVDYVSAPGCTLSGTRTVTCTASTLASGATLTRTITTTVLTSAPATITNTATVGSDTPDPTAGNNSSTASTTTVKRADVSVAKTAPAGPLTAGSALTYTLQVGNAGPDTATDVVVTDVLPAGVTFVSADAGCAYTVANRTVTCTIASLSSGASVTRTISTSVVPDAPATITNTATVTAAQNDPTAANNTSSASTTTARRADLAITKTAPAGPLRAGDAIAYGLTVRNDGPDTATAVTITDVLPTGVSFTSASGCTYDGGTRTVTCVIGTLASGATATRTINGTLTANAGATLVNTAEVTSATTDPDPANNTDSATTSTAKAADLAITKTAPAGPVRTGDALAFTLAVENKGPDAASDVTVTDVLPTSLAFVSADAGCAYDAPTRTVTCTIATLADGATKTWTVRTEVTAAGGATIANTATVDAATPDPVAGNDTSTSTTQRARQADLRIAKSGPAGPLRAGDPIAYELTVTNDGPDAATGAVITDVLPAGFTFGGATNCTYDAGTRTVSCAIPSLSAGGSVTRTITGLVAADAPSTITNTATVTSATPDPDPADNRDGAATTTVKRADLAIEKSAPAGPIAAGAALTYTLKVTNRGPDTAQAVVVTDELPDGVTFESASAGCTYDAALRTVTCSRANLAPNAVATFEVRTRVGGTVAGTVTNTATVASATPDPDAANDRDDATTAVAADADVSVTKTADDTTPNPGQTVTYTLTARNDGPATATGTTVSDTLPAGLTFVSADPRCAVAGTTVTCDAGDLAAGQSTAFAVRVTANPLDGADDPNATAQITTTKVEQQIDLQPGETKTASVSCAGGGLMTDGSFRVDAVDQGTGTLADVHALENRQTGDGTWTTTLRNDATGRAQAKVFGVCITLSEHQFVVSAPVTATRVLPAGRHDIDLPCGTGQTAIAPGFQLVGGDARVLRSEDAGTGWTFRLDVPTSTTATVSIRCLSTVTSVVDGHVHALQLTHPEVGITVGAGQTTEVDVTCADDAKGIVATSDLAPGLVPLGNDPRPKTRTFKVYNPTGGTLSGKVDLLCLGDRTGGEVGSSRQIDNTATVSSSAPDADTSDNASTVRIDVQDAPTTAPAAAPASDPAPAPAPTAPPTADSAGTPDSGAAALPVPVVEQGTPEDTGSLQLTTTSARFSGTVLPLTVACPAGRVCKATARVVAARRLSAGGRTYKAGAVLGRSTFTVGAKQRRTVRVTLGKAKVRALKRAGQRSVVVRLTSNGSTIVKRLKVR